MHADLFASEPTHHFTLRCRRWGFGERRYPHDLETRRLADTLVEFATDGAWSVEDLDAGVTLQASAGNVLVVPAERLHTLRMVRGRPMRSDWFFLALEDQIGRDAFMSIPQTIVLSPVASARAVKALKKLQQCLERVAVIGVGELVAQQRLGLELAAIILEGSPEPVTPLPRSIDERIERVLRYIHSHLHERLTRNDLARHAHLSPTRFHYVFLDATGQPPMQYLMAQRLRRARQLLLSGTVSSKEVGRLCGFVSPNHFTRTFSSWTSMSPLAYRHQMQDRQNDRTPIHSTAQQKRNGE